MMKTKAGLLLFLAMALVTVAVGSPALVQARGATVPFHVDCTTYPDLDTSGFPLLVATIPADCIGTHLGNSHWFSVAKVWVEGPPPWRQWDEEMVFTSANGSLLIGYYEGHFVSYEDGTADWWGDYWITEGTGRFEGYTGSGTYYGGGDGQGNANVIFNGTLTKP